MKDIKQLPRFFGRRKGRPLSTVMQKRLDELLPEFVLPAGPHTTSSLLACFPVDPSASLSLEIGFGGGEHLAALAKASPDTAFIGAEPFINGIVSLLRHIDEQNLKNIRIWPDDVRLILDNFPESSFTSVYVMFPVMPEGGFSVLPCWTSWHYVLSRGEVCVLPAITLLQNLGCWLRFYVIPHLVGRPNQLRIGVYVLLTGHSHDTW